MKTLFAALLVFAVAAQDDRFEVVSIRRVTPPANLPAGARGGGGGASTPRKGSPPQITPGRVVLNNNSLYTLIAWTYGLECVKARSLGLISGGPDWVTADQWLIQATLPAGADLKPTESLLPLRTPIADPKLQLMMRHMLADRFKLAVHRETKEVPVYELTAGRDGFKRVDPRNAACVPREPASPKPDARPYCTLWATIKMADFVSILELEAGRPVIDKTGLTGTFEIRLLWSLDPIINPDAPSLFTALQEQLGLKLESAKGPGEFIVIDRVERPAEN